ncbi:NrtA/SsuA/CpmA family ABC transporter substrate-binding protein [Leucobacter sp. CSA1]|uniref:NrtA/SsuA/CpmA family ABC transporter substrate-binding protein n=1 Tax=Leucobacter chromiisoli TaxID=2796471 RepID=A0A934Q7T9_9MICO|nr:NrtA/SsuA/CpmA family ABC transporter substrate-binding protein [Leucobacter chromiisoli]MBK0419288.1 NrtA/SsuA/CpmA family ABC transporter substrate-binding protein [Leucobacter chromiisoli]
MHPRPKTSRRLGAIALLLAVPAMLLSACTSGSALEQGARADEGSTGDGAYTLKVTDPVNNGWLAVAKRDGTLEDALEPLGTTVEWVPAKGAVSANLPLFSTGEIQVSEGAFTPVVGAASQDAPIRVGAVLGTEAAGDDSGIVATEASGASDVADLAGKSIAVNPAGKGEYIVLLALERAGLAKDDVELQYLQPAEALSAFTSGKVDAVATFGDFFRQAQETGTVVATERDIDSQDREIILFTADLLADRPDIAQAVVEAAGPVVAARSEHPEDYVNVFDSSGPRALEGDALDWQVRVNGANPATLRVPDEQDRERLQSIIDVFAANGVIPEGVTADDLVADLG